MQNNFKEKENYRFTKIKDTLLKDPAIKETLEKWGILNFARFNYRFDIPYQPYNTENFLLNLLNQPEILDFIKKDKITDLKFSIKNCSLLNFNFIDYFYEKGKNKKISLTRILIC
jgi:hypothetical protein